MCLIEGVPNMRLLAAYTCLCSFVLRASTKVLVLGRANIGWDMGHACSGSWRNGFHWPVLKHGPRSLTYMRVFGWKTLMRNESEGHPCGGWGRNVSNRDTALSTDLSFMKDLSKSISVGTRKMVNYAWAGRSQGKLWWRLERDTNVQIVLLTWV